MDCVISIARRTFGRVRGRAPQATPFVGDGARFTAVACQPHSFSLIEASINALAIAEQQALIADAHREIGSEVGEGQGWRAGLFILYLL